MAGKSGFGALDNKYLDMAQEYLEEMQETVDVGLTVLGENPKDRLGMRKPPLRLVPPALRLYASRAMEDGANKYGPYNWRDNAVNLTVYIEAAGRHLDALLDGEDINEDSGVHHAGHVAACMAIILDAMATGNLIDDRPTPGAAAKIIKELTRND